jgi:plastocyanin
MSSIARSAVLSLIGLLLSASLGLAFWEAGNGEGFAPEPPQENAIIDVSIVNFDFLPPIISIDVGDQVRWTNNSSFSHTSTSGSPFDPDPGSIWDSGPISPGGTFTFTFDTPGNYHYFCTPHPLMMFGEVIVGGAGLMVAIVPDDICPGCISNLDMNVAVFNFTPNTVSGNLWFTIRLPNDNELVIPPQFLTPSVNPLAGQLAGNDRLDLLVTLHVPQNAPSGEYRLSAKIGNYPNQVVADDDFEFEVP